MSERNKNEKKVINIWNEEEYVKDPRYDHPSTDKTHHNYNPKHFQMFGPNKIALAEELRDHHQELVGLIQKQHGMNPDWELVLAHVASYCEVVLDGEYNEEELEKLAGILRDKLMQGRLEFLFEHEENKEKDTDKGEEN